MKTSYAYGLGIGVATFVLTLILHILGFMTDPARLGTGLGVLGTCGVLLFPVVGIVLGMKKVRAAKTPAEGFSYGEALKTGVAIGLVTAVAAVVFNLIYYQFINPDYGETSAAWTRSFMERMNAPQARIDEAVEKALHPAPGRQATVTLLGGVVLNSVLSLIIAAFLKRAPVDPLKGGTN